MKTTKKLATLVLDPKRWLRGDMPSDADDASSMLRRPSDGLMCCLGFECVRRGANEASINGLFMPTDLDRVPGGRRIFMQKCDNTRDLENTIAAVNDDISIPLTRAGDLARVRELRPLFERLGVRLVLGRDK